MLVKNHGHFATNTLDADNSIEFKAKLTPADGKIVDIRNAPM